MSLRRFVFSIGLSTLILVLKKPIENPSVSGFVIGICCYFIAIGLIED